MNVQEFRDYCMSLKGTTEKMPWTKQPQYENLLVFSVGDKWYCFVDIEKFEFCDLKCDPEKSKGLQTQYEGITPGWHMNKKHWISVHFNSDVPDDVIKQLIASSYNLVLHELPHRQQEELEE
ncbi:MmcQ/YjbR family DNA-binding protein [uncultured Duncaniella sp.]|uniref:MmcQ/YjbR family DNA-binding protein n=2 Tax=Muribaculaceae TaxID=2005473 RepID=UPI000AC05F04|nr:MmcQ/YjbR family DNA-binding protein [uncultured Duncaniella sp.]